MKKEKIIKIIYKHLKRIDKLYVKALKYERKDIDNSDDSNEYAGQYILLKTILLEIDKDIFNQPIKEL